MAIAGCVQKIARVGDKTVVFFFTASGEYVEIFDNPKEALRWVVKNNMEIEEPLEVDFTAPPEPPSSTRVA